MNATNAKVSFNQLVVKALYYRYKLFVIPVSTIGICVVLFFFVIIPQIQSWLAMRDQISGDTQKLATLQQNLQIISHLDDTKLDTYLSIASSALPAEKDFAGVLQAVSSAAGGAGTILGDYTFDIGDLGGADSKNKTIQLPLQLTVNIKGDITTGRRFIEELKKQLPLSDVTAIAVNSNGTIAITATFYFAPLPKITFDDSVPLVTLSPRDEEVLKLLQATENTAAPLSVATSSAR